MCVYGCVSSQPLVKAIKVIKQFDEELCNAAFMQCFNLLLLLF